MKSKLFFFSIILIVFANCRSKKVVTEYKEVVKRDSIFVTKEKLVVKRFTDTLTIKKPCDSVGNLKPFKRTFVLPQGKISLQGSNNQIEAKIDLKGYESTIERKYKTIYDKKVSELSSKEVKYKTPFYHWFIHVLCALVIFLLLRIR